MARSIQSSFQPRPKLLSSLNVSQHIFETSRLILRELHIRDATGMFLLDSNPAVHRYLGYRFRQYPAQTSNRFEELNPKENRSLFPYSQNHVFRKIRGPENCTPKRINTISRILFPQQNE